MKRILGLFILLLTLSGCAGNDIETSPWANMGSQQAVSDPSQIATPARPAVQPPVQAQTPSQFPAPPAPAGHPSPVKVALLLPLTGKNADLGQSMLQAAQLALFDLGYDSFELMPRDTRATPEGAKAAAESAIGSGAQLLLGPLFSQEVRAAKPVAAMHNVNMVAFSTDWAQAGGNAYIMGFLPFSQVKRVVEFAVSKGYRRIGIVAPQTDYGNAIVNYYAALSSRYGLQQPVIARTAAGQSDYTIAVQPFLMGGTQGQPAVDAILIAAGGDQASRIAAALTAAGMGPDRVKRLGTGLWDESQIARDPNLAGAWYAAPQPDLRRAFEQKYWATYNQAPPRLATLSYDATALAAVLARKSAANNGTPAFDRTSIGNPNGFSGIDGIFRFQNDGLVDRGMAILEISGGAARVIATAPQTFQKQAF